MCIEFPSFNCLQLFCLGKGAKKLGKVWSFTKPCCIDNSLLSLRIWAVRATFKTVLMAVDKTYALQTKRKTCFGGPIINLQAQLKIHFQNWGVVFFYPR